MDVLAAKVSEIWNTLSGISVLWAILAVILTVAIYFLPTILAAVVGNTTRRIAIIGVLDLVLGWTIVGWFALLAWAIIGRPRNPDDELELSPFAHTPGTN